MSSLVELILPKNKETPLYNVIAEKVMLSTHPVKTMHDFNEPLLSQHYVSSPRTISRTDTAIRQERTLFFCGFYVLLPF